MKPILLGFAAIWLALGCTSERTYGPASPYYRYPEGSRLILNTALEVPADWATLRLQLGRTVAFGAVQEQEPHCIFEIATVRPQAQRIEPDSFAIVGVRRSVSDLAAAPGFFIRSALADSDLPSQMFYKTEFFLRSERQPNVRRLTCQHDQYAAGIGIPRHLTLAEIRAALGTLFTLQLP
ncbi:MAG: hypothetical protein HXY26_05745 [Hydrogenophilaceae bacterium]|nr:hypothetical protein [Hydrogenophilaceae bacterium]